MKDDGFLDLFDKPEPEPDIKVRQRHPADAEDP